MLQQSQMRKQLRNTQFPKLFSYDTFHTNLGLTFFLTNIS